jgi:hypothetical protein
MQTRILIFALAILASPAMAIDFRGSEFGGPCSSISEREHALGSREMGDPSSHDQHRFTGRVFGRDVLITYLCKDGSLALGDYHFSRHLFADAVPDFDAAYTYLSATYGAPFFQYSSDQKGLDDETLLPRAGDKPKTYSASWKGSGFHANLALVVLGDRAGPNWQAFVVFTP